MLQFFNNSMLPQMIFVIVAIVATLIGSAFDLKSRWVPDYVNYFMIFFGLGGHAILSVTQNSVWPFAYSLIAVGVLYGLSAVLFYTGVWGGGDAKMLIGLGALLATVPNLVFVQNFPVAWPFLITLWTNTLVFGAVIGFIGTFYLAARHFSGFRKELLKFLEKKEIKIIFAAVLLLIPVSYYFEKTFALFSSMILAFIVLFLIFKSVENACMYKFIAPKKLVEGDWVVDEIKVAGVHYDPNKSGIEKKDILKLVELERLGKLEKIKIKEGLPYVPAFFLGLIASLFYGDLMFKLITILT